MENWAKVRDEWTKNSLGTNTEYDSEDLDEYDDEQILECVRTGEKFPQKVPLGIMVEILSSLWSDEDIEL